MEIRKYVEDDVPWIKDIYQRAFAGFPWYENLSMGEVNRRWQQQTDERGFDCLVAMEGEMPRGAIWWNTPTLGELRSERGAILAEFADRILKEHLILVWERDLIVAPEHQRKGMGTYLRRAFLAEMTKGKSALVLTRMRDDNKPTILIATKLGFAKTSIKVSSSQNPNLFHEYWYFVVERTEDRP